MILHLSLNISLMCAIDDSSFSIVIFPAPPDLKLIQWINSIGKCMIFMLNLEV